MTAKCEKCGKFSERIHDQWNTEGTEIDYEVCDSCFNQRN